MGAKRFKTGGTGMVMERTAKRSKVRFGILVTDPATADKDNSVVINQKMIFDQVEMSRICKHSSEDFISAINELAANPNIIWDRPSAQNEFIKAAEDVWFRKSA